MAVVDHFLVLWQQKTIVVVFVVVVVMVVDVLVAVAVDYAWLQEIELADNFPSMQNLAADTVQLLLRMVMSVVVVLLLSFVLCHMI